MSAIQISETTIYQPVVVKTLANQEQLIQELLRSTLLGFYQVGSAPLGVSGNSLMFSKIQGTNLRDIWTELTDQQQKDLLEQLVGLLLELQTKYQQSDVVLLKKLNLDLDWRSFVVKNLRFVLAQTLPVVGNLASDIKVLLRIKSNLTLSHGDLGLSNILLSGTALRLIDFEHVMEAPLEFDLTPSLFWKDSNSLPTDKIEEILGRLGKPVDQLLLNRLTKLYLINQLRIAKEASDLKKTKQLLNKALERKLI